MNAHLLIVDDDERIRSLLKQFLLLNGFLVSAARDAMHCLLYTSPSPRDLSTSRMPSSA